MALSAYRNAERMMAAAVPGCGVSWNLLAGIGRIESLHANGGATDTRGTAVRPIYGPALDGTLPGNEVIVQSRTADRVTYARAMGPMQFLPGTWSRYACDGDGDGKADVQNLFDASLAAARYLCSGGLNLRDQSQVMAAILRYNNSVAYARNVLGWAAAYATGVVPVDLPPIVGSRRPTRLGQRRSPGQLPGPRARPADERAGAARRRPAGVDAADGRAATSPSDVPVLARPDPRTAARACAAGASAAGAARTGAAAVAAAVDAAASVGAAAAAVARCSASRTPPAAPAPSRRCRRHRVDAQMLTPQAPPPPLRPARTALGRTSRPPAAAPGPPPASCRPGARPAPA